MERIYMYASAGKYRESILQCLKKNVGPEIRNADNILQPGMYLHEYLVSNIFELRADLFLPVFKKEPALVFANTLSEIAVKMVAGPRPRPQLKVFVRKTFDSK